MVSIKYNDHNSRKLAQLAVEHMTEEELKAYVTTDLDVRYWLDPDDFYCYLESFLEDHELTVDELVRNFDFQGEEDEN